MAVTYLMHNLNPCDKLRPSSMIHVYKSKSVRAFLLPDKFHVTYYEK